MTAPNQVCAAHASGTDRACAGCEKARGLWTASSAARPSAVVGATAPAGRERRGPVLNTRRAAEYCGLAHQTLRNLLAAGQGPKVFKQGRLNAFYESDLSDWVASRLTDPDAPGEEVAA